MGDNNVQDSGTFAGFDAEVKEADLPESFWDDDEGAPGAAEGETSPAAGEEPPPAGEEPPAADTPTEPPEEQEATIPLKYLGEEVRIPVSKAAELAQKGMNYDRLLEKIENSPERRVIAEYAKASGLPYDAYLRQLADGLQSAQVDQLVEQGVPKPAAQELHRLKMQEAQHQAQRQAQEQQQAALAAQRQQREKLKEGMVELLQAYPDLQKETKLPPGVVKDIARGVPPLYAYKAHEAELLKTQLAASNAAKKNKEAPGSAQGVGGGAESDPFLAGFYAND